MKKTKASAGISLVETLIYVVLSSVLLLSLSSYFILSTSARVKNQTIAEVDQQGTFIMDKIVQTVRNASAVTVPAVAGTGNQVSLTMPIAGDSPTVFNLSGDVMQIKEGSATAVSLSNNLVQVSGLSFSNVTRSGSYGAVKISFTVSRVKNVDRNEYDYAKTFTTTVSIRP